MSHVPERRRSFRASDVQIWIGIAGALIAGGMWLGSLSNRVAQLEKLDRYLHGTIAVPEAK